MEYEKVRSAVEMGAEAIMDLSSYGDTRSFRRKLTADCPAMIGTVPIYDAVVYYHKPLAQITAEEWLDIVRMHAEDGLSLIHISYTSGSNAPQIPDRAVPPPQKAPPESRRHSGTPETTAQKSRWKFLRQSESSA